ncbi:hypothetical protein K469DRAFT_802158, partial [Zopfia rhizophila CBS 207.26]
TLEGHGSSVNSVAFSHDSAGLASSSDDKTVKIWNASSGECLQTFGIGKAIFNISFDTTDSYLHTESGTIVIDASDALSASNMTPNITGSKHPRYQGGALSSDGAWITYCCHKINLLPVGHTIRRLGICLLYIAFSCPLDFRSSMQSNSVSQSRQALPLLTVMSPARAV